MKITKLRYVLSKDFIAFCAENLAKMGMVATIRSAERRFYFRNPKSTFDIEIDESDVNRAVAIANGTESKFDRLANVYSWLKSHSKDTLVAGRTMSAALWSKYRAYITANRLENLWVVTRVYDDAAHVSDEFVDIMDLVAADA